MGILGTNYMGGAFKSVTMRLFIADQTRGGTSRH